MHRYRELIRSSAIFDACVGYFCNVQQKHVVLLKDRMFELRSIEKCRTSDGNMQSWLMCCLQQEYNERILTIQILTQNDKDSTKLDLLVTLKENAAVSILSFDDEQKGFISVAVYDLKHVVFKPSALSVCSESGDIAVASNTKSSFATVHHPSGLVRAGNLPCHGGSILSIQYFTFMPQSRRHNLAFLLKTEYGSLICIYDCFQRGLGKETECIELVLRMPIPLESIWNKDYGRPQAMVPIPHHSSGMALICEKAVCFLDFGILKDEEKVRDLFIDRLPMLWPSASASTGKKSPVQIVREFTFFATPLSRTGDDSEFAWDTLMRQQIRDCPAEDFNNATAYGFLPPKENEKSIHGKQQRTTLKLFLKDGTVQSIRIAFSASPLQPWRMVRSNSEAIRPFLPGMRFLPLPFGEWFLYSKIHDHMVLMPEIDTQDKQEKYKVIQIIENGGPIVDFIPKKLSEHETGRVLYTAASQEGFGSIKEISPDVMTEDLCVSFQFSCLSRLWKIRPVDQAIDIIIASFLQETRALVLKDGVFVDATHLIGILSDEPTLHCSPINPSHFIQVTPTRVALCGSRLSEDFKLEKQPIHTKHSSSNSMTSETMLDTIPRRWSYQFFSFWNFFVRRSFSGFNSQLSSMFRFPEKVPSRELMEPEQPENIWELGGRTELPNGHDGSSLTPRGFLDLSFRVRRNERHQKAGQIVCASVGAEIVCLFVDITSSLTILGIHDERHGVQPSTRKRIRSSTRLKTILDTNLPELNPSCICLDSEISCGSLLCIVGTYQPSIEVFEIDVKNKRMDHVYALKDAEYGMLFPKGENQDINIHKVDRQPVPEDIKIIGHDDKKVTTLLVAFRDGCLGEFIFDKIEKEIRPMNFFHVGALPVTLEVIRKDLLLATSNRSFLFKLKPNDSLLTAVRDVQEIQLPSHVRNCTVLTFPSDMPLWKESEDDRVLELPAILEELKNDVRLRYLFVYVDMDGMLRIAGIQKQVKSISIGHPIEKLIRIPNCHHLIAVSKANGLFFVDMEKERVCCRFRLNSNEVITAACLWPSNRVSRSSSLSNGFRGRTQTEGLSELQSERGFVSRMSEDRLQKYMKTIRGMAAAFSCCHVFGSCPSTESSPRIQELRMSRSEETKSNEFRLVIGTGVQTNSSISESTRRGSLRLLRIHACFDAKFENWTIESSAYLKLPDPVGAIADLDSKTLMVTIGSRIVPYRIASSKWEKSEGWVMTRDPVTSLSICDGTMATGDKFNGVVIYEHVGNRGILASDHLRHVLSDRNSRNIVAVHTMNAREISALDDEGNFLSFSCEQENLTSSERHLTQKVILPLNIPLTCLVSTTLKTGKQERWLESSSEGFLIAVNTNANRIVGLPEVNDAYMVSSRTGSLFLVSHVLTGNSCQRRRAFSTTKEMSLNALLNARSHNAKLEEILLAFDFS